jgi:hypothetical protein
LPQSWHAAPSEGKLALFGYRSEVLKLGPGARTAFACCWLVGQIALILTARDRPDGAFAFRMFPEASTIEIRLARELEARIVAVPRGEWAARDARDQLRHFSWRDRVRDPTLASVDARVFAPYGADAQLARLQRALDDVVDHVPEDAETIRLLADVLVWKNGREPFELTLQSHARQPK